MSTKSSNQTLEPTTPPRNKSTVIGTTPSISSRCPASLVRFAFARSRTVFTKTESSASPGALLVLGTSRRKVRVLRTAPALLFFNASRGLSLSR
jgi:hypothetical protein